MSSPCLLVCKYVDLFRTTISKVILFKSSEIAYEYGLLIDKHINKEIINPYEISLMDKIIWKSSKHSFPTYICEIISIDSDLLCNIYQGADDSKRLIEYIYKSLKVNDLIN